MFFSSAHVPAPLISELFHEVSYILIFPKIPKVVFQWRVIVVFVFLSGVSYIRNIVLDFFSVKFRKNYGGGVGVQDPFLISKKVSIKKTTTKHTLPVTRYRF